jgi:hypothetical protein
MFVCAVVPTWQSGEAAELALKTRKSTARGRTIRRALTTLNNMKEV